MKKNKAKRVVLAVIATVFFAWIVVVLTRASRMPDVPGTRVEVAKPHCADPRTIPFKVPGIAGAKAIAFQGGHLVALDGDGHLWSYFVERSATCEVNAVAIDPAQAKMGHIASSSAALGLTSTGSLVTWEPFEWHRLCPPGFTGGTCSAFLQHRFDGLRDAAGSSSHLVLVTNEGSVLSGGMNDCGQTGRSDHLSTSSPLSIAAVPGLTDIVAVASGKRNSVALARDGRVWAWGNLSNPLIGSWSPPLPTADAVYCQGSSDADEPAEGSASTPIVVPGLPPIAAIASFHGYDLALDRQGRVWGWGYNDCGQLGVGGLPGDDQAVPAIVDGLPPISALAAGGRYSVFLGIDGSVWAVGNNEFSQLATTTAAVADGKTCQSSTQAAGVAPHSAKPSRVQGIGPAIAVAADSGHSAAIDAAGHVWIWGRYP